MTLAVCFWFEGDAEEALKHYASLLPGFEWDLELRLSGAQAGLLGAPAGAPLAYAFRCLGLEGQAMSNAPATFSLNPSLSMHITLPDEAEIRRIWEGLVEGGDTMMPLQAWPWSPLYGWLRDRFGLSWQVTLSPDAAPLAAPALLFARESYGYAEEAVNHYVSLFEAAKKELMTWHDGSAADPEGELQYAEFTLLGQAVRAMQGGGPDAHPFTFNEAGSLVVLCRTQAEIDRYWAALSAVPEAEQCGWLMDRHGVRWQIVPAELHRLLAHEDEARGTRVMEAMLGMKRLNLDALRNA